MPHNAYIVECCRSAIGKRTMLQKLGGNVITMIPTQGFNIQTADTRGSSITLVQLGGEERFRPLLVHYLQKKMGLIFVVNATDRSLVDKVRTELLWVLGLECVRGVPLLVFANKQEQERA
eukprot:Hpha_TRINITY_DN9775_c0_g2::TRINITY_DN9775_c0_g2_i2::g.10155::m.10155/K07937/ARF1; ADP-ribosylation factor 1